MTLTPTYALSLPPDPPKPIDLSCLSRPEKEAIDVCFKQNADCHLALSKAETPPAPVSSWTKIGLYVLAGVVTGMVVEGQLKK